MATQLLHCVVCLFSSQVAYIKIYCLLTVATGCNNGLKVAMTTKNWILYFKVQGIKL